MTTENSLKKQGDGKFKPGQSGNPAGKPKGARSATTLMIEALLDGQAKALTQAAIDKALSGDITALKLCLDRLAPPRKDRPVTFEMPAIDVTHDLPKATLALMQAVAAGELTPSEAAELGKLIDAHVRAIELTDINRRLEALEGKP